MVGVLLQRGVRGAGDYSVGSHLFELQDLLPRNIKISNLTEEDIST